jgi:hypothetical protein
MNDLTTPPAPTPNSLPSRPTTTALGPDLSRLLDSEESPDEVAREIACVPALVEEARQALPALHRVATAKAGEDGVRRVIGKRFETYPQPQRTDEQWAAWWADYYDVLSDVALASLEAGMRAYVADPQSEFMPKPGKLRELSFTAPCRSLARYYRANLAVQLADTPPPAPRVPVDPETVRQALADFKAKRVPTQKPVVIGSIAGVPDERGITAEMRAAIARRAEMRR